MEQARSAIPKVVGVLMIVFGAIGLVWTVIVMFQEELFKEVAGMDPTISRTGLIFDLVAVALGLLQLVAGLRAISYKDRAPRLAVMYAVGKIVSVIGWVVVTYAYLIPHIGASRVASQSLVDGSGIAITAGFYLIWPIIVLALMTRPSVKTSCTNF
jgi:hypothetical protein